MQRRSEMIKIVDWNIFGAGSFIDFKSSTPLLWRNTTGMTGTDNQELSSQVRKHGVIRRSDWNRVVLLLY